MNAQRQRVPALRYWWSTDELHPLIASLS